MVDVRAASSATLGEIGDVTVSGRLKIDLGATLAHRRTWLGDVGAQISDEPASTAVGDANSLIFLTRPGGGIGRHGGLKPP